MKKGLEEKFQKELQNLILERKAEHDAVDDFYDDKESALVRRYEEDKAVQVRMDEIRQLEERLEQLRSELGQVRSGNLPEKKEAKTDCNCKNKKKK